MNLGKLRQIGDTFQTTTKQMTKTRHNCKFNKDLSGPLITYEVLRPGDKRFYTKGKRRYYCMVLAMVEIKTGYNCHTVSSNSLYKAPRWWQFTYLVRIIEN